MYRFLSMPALLALTLVDGAAGTEPDLEEILRRGACVSCHEPVRAMVGPSFQDIARRNASPGAVDVLVSKLRRETSGHHGPIPMGPVTPNRLTDAELRMAIEWMIKSGAEQGAQGARGAQSAQGSQPR